MKKIFTSIVLILLSINVFSVELNDAYFKKLDARQNEIKEKAVRIKNQKIDLDDTSNALANDFVMNDAGDAQINGFVLNWLKSYNEGDAADSWRYPPTRSVLVDYFEKFSDRVESLRPEFKRINQENRKRGISLKDTWNFLQESFLDLENWEEHKEFLLNLKDLDNNIKPRYTKIGKKRESAKNDVVSQVLNYSAGTQENASGSVFFYPEANGKDSCTYAVAIDKSDARGSLASLANEFLSAMNQMSELSGMTELHTPMKGESSSANVVIDLKKADLKNVSFFKIQSRTRNKFTGYQANLIYQTRVEGLPDMFQCDSNQCNIDRLKRGWQLIQEKCKGIQKPF